VLGLEPGDAARERVLVLVEVGHAGGGVEAGTERGGDPDRHHVVDVVREQVKPFLVVLGVQEVCLVDEPLVGQQVTLVVEGQAGSRPLHP
jgi:hypothetical protein